MSQQKTWSRPDISETIFCGMATASLAMMSFFEQLQRVARTDSAVLIRGESGTGKELAARAIHSLSRRQKGPYHSVNCATLSAELAASELFGHAAGAFTGAAHAHKGFFEASDTGSLFLDEVAELLPSVQSRLLRVLQDRTFHPVGSTRMKRVDVRLISATHRALRTEVAQGRFREDLMYRIRVVPIFLPRLADRGSDLEILTWRFIDEFNTWGLRQIKQIETAARDALYAYHWPGNIRELRNNIEYAFAVGEGETLKASDLPPELRGEAPPESHHFSEKGRSDSAPESSYREEANTVLRARIQRALLAAGGNRGLAAGELGISRATLWRRMRELGLR